MTQAEVMFFTDGVRCGEERVVALKTWFTLRRGTEVVRHVAPSRQTGASVGIKAGVIPQKRGLSAARRGTSSVRNSPAWIVRSMSVMEAEKRPKAFGLTLRVRPSFAGESLMGGGKESSDGKCGQAGTTRMACAHRAFGRAAWWALSLRESLDALGLRRHAGPPRIILARSARLTEGPFPSVVRGPRSGTCAGLRDGHR